MNDRDLKERSSRLQKALPEKTAREYRVDFLERLALRAIAFEAKGCTYCGKIIEDLDVWLTMLEQEHAISSEKNSAFFMFISTATRHMMSEHHLVTSRQYLVTILPLCFILGLITGWLLRNIGLGALIGIAVGIAFGIIMDMRAMRRNRVI